MANFVDSLQIIGDGGLVNVEDNCVVIRPQSRFQQAVERGDAFCWACVTQNFEAGDTLIGLQNDETTRNLYIERIDLSTLTTTQVMVFGTKGITVAGDNAISGVCLNRNFSRIPSTTCYDDETGQDQAASSWPTRWASGLALAGQTLQLKFGGNLIMGASHYLGVDAVADVAGANVTIWGWFE